MKRIAFVFAVMTGLLSGCVGMTKATPPMAESVGEAVKIESAATSGGRVGVDITAAVVRQAQVDPATGKNLSLQGWDTENRQVGGYVQTNVVQASESTDKAVTTAIAGTVPAALINFLGLNMISRRGQCNSPGGCGNVYNVPTAIADSVAGAVNETRVNAGVNTANPRRLQLQQPPQGK